MKTLLVLLLLVNIFLVFRASVNNLIFSSLLYFIFFSLSSPLSVLFYFCLSPPPTFLFSFQYSPPPSFCSSAISSSLHFFFILSLPCSHLLFPSPSFSFLSSPLIAHLLSSTVFFLFLSGSRQCNTPLILSLTYFPPFSHSPFIKSLVTYLKGNLA